MFNSSVRYERNINLHFLTLKRTLYISEVSKRSEPRNISKNVKFIETCLRDYVKICNKKYGVQLKIMIMLANMFF